MEAIQDLYLVFKRFFFQPKNHYSQFLVFSFVQ